MIRSPVLILGARSDIGRALAQAYVAKGCEVVLGARGDLERERLDMVARNDRPVRTVAFDVTDGQPDRFFDALGVMPGTVVMVAGLLGDQQESAMSDEAAARVLDTNYVGPARYLLAAARRMTAMEGACIIGISSVAGDRGRGSNYVYGSAKAGLTAFLSGLRNAHARTGLHVMTVKPGFVATRMTAGMKLPPPLTAQPAQVADAILAAQEKRRDVIYVLGRWRLVMTVIGLIPERIFKRLTL
jgi:decaprenylphospho-beta-D-erythro-pentofuranosid-2-ulose 2-reductase